MLHRHLEFSIGHIRTMLFLEPASHLQSLGKTGHSSESWTNPRIENVSASQLVQDIRLSWHFGSELSIQICEVEHAIPSHIRWSQVQHTCIRSLLHQQLGTRKSEVLQTRVSRTFTHCMSAPTVYNDKDFEERLCHDTWRSKAALEGPNPMITPEPCTTPACGKGISCKSSVQGAGYISGTGWRKPKEGSEANADAEQELPNFWAALMAKCLSKLRKTCAFSNRVPV